MRTVSTANAPKHAPPQPLPSRVRLQLNGPAVVAAVQDLDAAHAHMVQARQEAAGLGNTPGTHHPSAVAQGGAGYDEEPHNHRGQGGGLSLHRRGRAAGAPSCLGAKARAGLDADEPPLQQQVQLDAAGAAYVGRARAQRSGSVRIQQHRQGEDAEGVQGEGARPPHPALQRAAGGLPRTSSLKSVSGWEAAVPPLPKLSVLDNELVQEGLVGVRGAPGHAFPHARTLTCVHARHYCTHTHTHIHTHIHTHTHTHTHVHTHTHTRPLAHNHRHVHAVTQVTRAYTHTRNTKQTYTHKKTCAYTRTHMRARTCMHAPLL